VCDARLDDPRRALGALTKLSELEPNDTEPLDRMDVLATLLADWPLLVQVLERKVEAALSDEDRAETLRRLGGVRRDMLDDAEGAIETYERALELAPESLETLDRLIALQQDRDPSRLVELLEQRIEYTGSIDPESEQRRHELILQAADVYQNKLDNRQEAIRMLQLALDARPTDLVVLEALEGLYEAEQMHDALLENLKTQASVTEEGEARLVLRNKIGDLYLGELDNAFDALEQFRLVLDERPDNATLLRLYALYKQATAGDVQGKRPGFIDLAGRAKHDAWAELEGLDPGAAKEQYVALVEELHGAGPTW